jgi:thiol-disulfide isomerase/thioredoxin
MVLASLLAARTRASLIPTASTAAVITAGTLLLAGCSAAPSPPSGTTSALNTGTTTFTSANAPRIPHVTGRLLTGRTLSPASYRGHVTVLNFWGSWCTVCREEAPALSAASRHFGPAGVRFIGVDVQDNTPSADAYMKDFKIAYPSLSDSSDQIALEFSQVIPDTAFPSTLIISRNQHITARIIGHASASNLSNLIEKAEKQP